MIGWPHQALGLCLASWPPRTVPTHRRRSRRTGAASSGSPRQDCLVNLPRCRAALLGFLVTGAALLQWPRQGHLCQLVLASERQGLVGKLICLSVRNANCSATRGIFVPPIDHLKLHTQGSNFTVCLLYYSPSMKMTFTVSLYYEPMVKINLVFIGGSL
jgi:hypothetical protein